MTKALLDVVDLRIASFGRNGESTTLVDGVSFSVRPGEIVGVVGESGSGKSLTMLGILGLLPGGVGTVEPTSIRIAGQSVTALSEARLRELRGPVVSLIPSDAGAALDPVARVGSQLDRVLSAHEGRATNRRGRILSILSRVRLPNPERVSRRFPHELSGGMQQRVAIASGVINGPRLIIADEPTTALDVTVQAQILKLLVDIRADTGAAILFVTHDMTTVAEICDRALVMYAGEIVEAGPADQLVTYPRHPYSRALLASVPPLRGRRPDKLTVITGAPPAPGSWPAGCRFRARCPLYKSLGEPDICATSHPPVVTNSGAACHFAESREDPAA